MLRVNSEHGPNIFDLHDNSSGMNFSDFYNLYTETLDNMFFFDCK